jgi:hypothetical protein
MIWVVMVILAIANGAFRDGVLAPQLGHDLALPISGLSLAAVIFIATYMTFPLIGKNTMSVYYMIGIQWVLMTLAFEFLFGHYVLGKPWSDIVQVFDLMSGNLFIMVLIVTLLAPYLVARLKDAL